MARTMDSRITAKIAGLYGQGDNITEIAEKVGVTRQTVYKHLRSPELQQIFEEAQTGAMDVLKASNALLLKTIEAGTMVEIQAGDSSEVVKQKLALKREAVQCAKELAKVLNAKVIEQTPKGSASVESNQLSAEERQILEDKARKLLGAGEPEVAGNSENTEKVL
jgi:AcrR family transcriptional regulator